MARQCATFFYREDHLRQCGFELEVRYDYEMLPRNSVVLGVMQGSTLLFNTPAWLNPLCPGIESVLRQAMSELNIPSDYKITELKDQEGFGMGSGNGRLVLLPPPPPHPAMTSNVPYLMHQNGEWVLVIGESQWAYLSTIILPRSPE